MFSQDFYPTPELVIGTMCTGVDLFGKTVLEPSAGSGNIIDFLKVQGANVIACENHPDLARIVASKCELIESDFLQLQADQITHVDFIIMNPPFSAEEKHILHAWDIAPGGCQIISLFNHDSLYRNYLTTNKQKVQDTVSLYGYKENLGRVFEDADRGTGIEIGLLRVFKPKTDPELEFENYFDLDDRFEAVQENGVMKYNEIQELVSRYVGAVKIFDDVVASSSRMNDLTAPIGTFSNIVFGALKVDKTGMVQHVSKTQFKKSLQKSAWRVVFKRFKINKYVTSSITGELDRFIEKQENFPFTLNNIYKMIEMIIGTNAERMNRVLVEAFERICSLSAENSEAKGGWKTNSDYKVNRRFIDTYVCEYDPRFPREYTKIKCGHHDGGLTDIIKALCFLTGKNFDEVNSIKYTDYKGEVAYKCNSLYYFFNENKVPWGTWVNWNDFFRVRGYKKGTMHFEFIDENVWMEFNIRVAKIKGWQLPRKTDTKKRGTERTRSKGVEIFQ